MAEAVYENQTYEKCLEFVKKFAGGSHCRKKDLVILKRGLRG